MQAEKKAGSIRPSYLSLNGMTAFLSDVLPELTSLLTTSKGEHRDPL